MCHLNGAPRHKLRAVNAKVLKDDGAHALDLAQLDIAVTVVVNADVLRPQRAHLAVFVIRSLAVRADGFVLMTGQGARVAGNLNLTRIRRRGFWVEFSGLFGIQPRQVTDIDVILLARMVGRSVDGLSAAADLELFGRHVLNLDAANQRLVHHFDHERRHLLPVDDLRFVLGSLKHLIFRIA